MRWVLLLLLFSFPALAQRPKLVVLHFTGPGFEPAELASATDRVAAVLARRDVYELISAREIDTLLGVERQKQLMGCSESACMAELSGAIGARFVMSGALAKLGDSFQLTLTVLDTQRSQPVGRAVRLASGLGGVFDDLAVTVAQAAGLPPPPEPSRALPLVLLGSGSAALVTGGVLGLVALTQEASLQGELSGSALGPMDSYWQRSQQPALLKSIALGTLIGGGALVALSIILWPRGIGGSGVALVPQPNGLVVVGGWP
ncbi:MAG: hypothetical protein JNM17_05360 [Archangium sp.]|nr:hypothetical protein [Archangium sp.]